MPAAPLSEPKKTTLRGAGFAIVRLFAVSVVRFIAWSSKIEVQGGEHLAAALASGRPCIFGMWHSAITEALVTRFRVQFPRFVTMISRSKDGDIAAEIARGFEVHSIRASSSKGGAAGLLEFIDRLGDGFMDGKPVAAFHLLDGPRGPRHESKPGVLLLARRLDALIVPLVFGASRRIVTRSWDRHCIPLPFGRLVVRFGPPIRINQESPEFSPADLDRISHDLAQGDTLCARDCALPTLKRAKATE